MERKLRKSGLDIIGDVPWGTHFCNFYETKQDLLDILMPFLRAGLENNEFCLWIVSDPLGEQEARDAVRNAILHSDSYFEKGQIEIVSYNNWYCRNGELYTENLFDDCVQIMKNALSRGFDGLRATGSMSWLEKKQWGMFLEYERLFNEMVDQVQMILLCSYVLSRCSAYDVIDVVNTHQFALFNREGSWEVIETSQHKTTQQVLRESDEKYRSIRELASGMAHEINNQMTVIQACLDLYVRDNSFDLAYSKIRQAVERTTKLN
ncbi:MAG: MEDS domain-containing protein, partial [Syntrophaceticus sp.]